MVTRRYTADYRLENRLSRSGKLKTEAVYKGLWFAFDASAQTVKKMRVLYTVCTTVAVAAVVSLLCLPAALGHIWYVVLPLAVGLLPAWLCAASLLRLWSAGQKVTREHHDKLGDRFSGASMGLSVLGGISLVGGIVYCALNGAQFTDLLFLALNVLYTGCGITMFAFRKNLSMHSLPAEE